MPTKITASTTKICRIRNANALKIQTLDVNGKELKTWAFKQDEREKMPNMLKTIANSNDPEVIYLDIMMPVDIIQVRNRQLFFLNPVNLENNCASFDDPNKL